MEKLAPVRQSREAQRQSYHLSRNVRIVPVLHKEKVGVSLATRVSTVFWTTGGESWCRRFPTDNKQFRAKQRMAKIVMRS